MASFIKDDNAAMEIPVRLVVYVILTGIIIAVAALGLQSVIPGMTTGIMEKQMGEIAVSLNIMQSGAARDLIDPSSATGNIRTFKITVPEDAGYLAFGVDPDPDNDGDLTNTRDGLITERGNVIFYSSSGGKKRIPLDDRVELREGLFRDGRWILNGNEGKQYGTVITGKGTFELTFELVYDPVSEKRYTLTHFTDELNACINPYGSRTLPNYILVSVDRRDPIPADGVTEGDVIVRLKGRKGDDAAAEGVEITLNTTLGHLASTRLVTDMKGWAVTNFTSDLVGTAVITARSPGLNPGSTYVTVKQVPVILDFNLWINRSDGDSLLTAQFITKQELNYSVSLKGYGTEFNGWPNASIEVDGVQIGEETIDSASLITRNYPDITLSAGNHTVKVSLTNDLYIPMLGDRNLYVERVMLSGS